METERPPIPWFTPQTPTAAAEWPKPGDWNSVRVSELAKAQMLESPLLPQGPRKQAEGTRSQS